MLTNLNFLDKGKKWPPEDRDERERLERYENNKQIFESKHYDVYREQFARIQRVIGNLEDIISYETILNYQKKVSIKTADFLFGEVPQIRCGDENSPQQKTVSQIIETSDLFNKSYEVGLDVSMLGTGVYYVYKDKENQGMVDVIQPAIWFPVVSEDNLKKTLYHVLAWTINNEYLKAQIHSKGSYEERFYSIESGKSGITIANLLSSQIIETGLNDFAVIPVHNILTSYRVYGMDDYDEIDTIISNLCVRCSQVDKILDEHADPKMTGPISAVVVDPQTKEARLPRGRYFATYEPNDPEIKYLTWEGQLEANFKHMEVLVNHLYVISEMGAVIFGDIKDKTGQAVSGTALRIRMLSVLAKVNRIKMHFDPGMKKAIKLCSQLGGKNIVNLTEERIDITWQDGLPSDPVEEANLMNTRTAGKATISQRTAVKTMGNLSEEATEAEMALIEEEESMSNPLSYPDLTGGNYGEETEKDNGQKNTQTDTALSAGKKRPA
jgi:SPP1 family phage portal protein